MKKFLILTIILGLAATVQAQTPALSPQLIDKCNEVMMDIYYEILKAKGDYDELMDFGNRYLSKNRYGIYKVEFKTQTVDSRGNVSPYAFGATIVKSNDTDFEEHGRKKFKTEFPLLGLKIVGYQIKSFSVKQYNLRRAIRKKKDVLMDLQQPYLPIQLSVKTGKEKYRVGEPVEFLVTIRNVSNKNIIVKDLSPRTLFFKYKRRSWGAQEVKKKALGNRLLKPGEFLSKRFLGEAFAAPEEIEVYVQYAMNFYDVKPSSTLKVKIIE